MHRILSIITLVFIISSCNNKAEKQNATPLTEEQKEERAKKSKLDFNNAVLIDSSVYVMYPLTLESYKESEESYGGSSTYRDVTTYSNIIFYNTSNGSFHLLDDSLQMIIRSYDANPFDIEEVYFTSTGPEFFKIDSLKATDVIYYSVKTDDYNKNGSLDIQDPDYLFISDKAGYHFKQISPDGLNIISWQGLKGTSKILMMATKDTNGDGVFNSDDESFPLVYDIIKNTVSVEIFNNEFKTQLKKQLDKYQ